MKKNYLLFLIAIVFSLGSKAQTTLTHNTGMVLGGNTVQCNGGDNGFARHFNLSDFGVSDEFTITSVSIGVQTNDASQTLTVKVWDTDASFPASFGSAVLLGTEDIVIEAYAINSNVVESFNLLTPIVVPASSTHIIVEFVQAVFPSPQFEIGATFGGTDTSYLRSLQCIGDPNLFLTVEDIGFPGVQYYITATGNETLSNDEFSLDTNDYKVFPNPTEDIINIQLNLNNSIKSAIIYDVLGQSIKREIQGDEINISDLQSGVYVLRVETDRGLIVQKVVKE